MRAVLRWTVSNSPLMILALILALLAWVVAAEEQDPTLTEEFPREIPVVISGLPEGLILVGDFDETVAVTISAPDSVWRTIEADDLAATVDLSEMGAGTHQAPVEVTLAKRPALVTWEPDLLTLELAPRAERSVQVHVIVEGEPALGYLDEEPVTVPVMVAVSGPSIYVAQVAEAVTVVSVQDANANVEGTFSLRPLDGEGQPVPNVSLVPSTANVSIPIELSGYYRVLTVRAVYGGKPTPGYQISYVSVEPPTVRVRGAPDVIAALQDYVETEPIDIEGIQTTQVSQPALNVPPDVVVVSDQQVTVEFFVEAIQSILTIEITPTLQGLEPGLTVTISPETVEVYLSGPQSQLEELTTGDVRLVLDLFDLPRGTHQIEPQLVVPAGVIAQSILPATVQVVLSVEPTGIATGEE